MKGRKPKPIARQIAEGDPRKLGRRKLQAAAASEPPARVGLPDCPRHLTGRARGTWNFLAEQLADMNLDRKPDAVTLEAVCVAYSRAVEADTQVEKEGITILEPILCNGEVVGSKIRRHPATAISREAWAQVKSFACEFGLTPVSRTRLASDKQDAPAVALATLLATPRAARQNVN